MPFVSVIIPVFNAGHFLEECVDSVLRQTLTDFDVCLVDDGSTDGSGILCDALATRHERIHAVHMGRNRGVSAARNRGIEETEGSWLCFVDGDDRVGPACLRTLAAAVEDGECDLAVAGLRSVRAGGKDVLTVPVPVELEAVPGREEEWVRLFRSFLLFGPVAKLYRRELVDRYRDSPDVVFLIDPPYMATDISTYRMDWKLTDYLDVLLVLKGHPFIYFTSGKSPILDFCRWMEEHPETGNPFKGAGMSTLTARMNYSSSYTDIMLYKEMTEAA